MQKIEEILNEIQKTTIEPEFKEVTRECPIHGPFVTKISAAYDESSFWFECPRCEAKKRLIKSGIPRKYIGAKIEDFETANIPELIQTKKHCQTYVRRLEKQDLSKVGNLLFVGNMGTGKTMLACAIAIEASKRFSVKFITAADLISDVRDSWNNYEVSEREAISQFTRPDFLIIDEIGIQAGTENEKNILFRVLNWRYNNGTPTVAISNTSPLEITNFINEMTLDRFYENGKVLVFSWTSFRRK